jgi:hypothetical protein
MLTIFLKCCNILFLSTSCVLFKNKRERKLHTKKEKKNSNRCLALAIYSSHRLPSPPRHRPPSPPRRAAALHRLPIRSAPPTVPLLVAYPHGAHRGRHPPFVAPLSLSGSADAMDVTWPPPVRVAQRYGPTTEPPAECLLRSLLP